MAILIMQFSLTFRHSVLSRSKYSAKNRALKRPQLCTSFKVRDQISHPYKTTSRITVMRSLIITFLDSKLQDKTFWTRW
jgi:hypothetical protein